MKQFFAARLLKCLLFLACLWPMVGSAAPFTPGNVVVLRVGDGSGSLSTAATPAYLQEYTPAGVLVQTIPLPTAVAGNNRILTVSGSSSTDGGMTRSANGAYLVVTGYDVAVGTTGVAGTASATNNRIVGRIAADGTVDTSTRIDDAYSTNNLRSATTVDGTAFYTAGSGGGVRYVPFGNPGGTAGTTVSISTTPSNLRYVNTFGGNLYISSGSSPYIGLSQVGTGLPTTSGQTATLLPGFPGTTSSTVGVSPLAFYFADLSPAVPGVDVVYVADDGSTTAGGGIQKWSLVGGTWTLNGVITGTVLRGLDGQTNGTTVTLVGTGNGGFTLLTDNAGYNAAPSTTTVPAFIATAGSSTAFRGAAFAPVAAAVAAPTITGFTPTSGAAGATVTITGTNFTGATAVTLNGAAITGFTVVNATTITFTVPVTGATSGTIAVTTPGGTATSTGTFTVTPAVAAPTISSFTPARAVTGVGFTLNVSGTNLVAGTTINFNGVSYTGTTAGSSGASYNVVIPASGVPAPGSYNITATNAGGTSAPLSFLVVAAATSVAYEDFETGTKGAYAAGTVTLRSGDWTFTDALIGNQFNDKVNQVQSARIRGGSIAMNFDKPNGAGTVTISAALYGSDAAASMILEVSTNGGTTYTAVGSPAALTTTLTPYTFTVNQAGNVRFRISSSNTTSGSNPRINVDDLNITNFTAGAAPTITSFTPGGGTPGTTITITGTNFTGATSLTVGAINITNFTVVNATTITFVVPTVTTGTGGNITIVTPNGTVTSTTPFNIVLATQASQALPGLLVFPNPATDRVTLTLPATGAATVALRDLTGRLVLAPATVGADKQVLLPAGLAAGVYVLEVRQGEVFAVRRIVKN